MMLGIGFLLWYLMGVGSFVYWWTSEYDLTIDQTPMMLMAGFGGPISFLMGWSIHGKDSDKVLFKKRD
jgi:hypothetical protein